MSGANGNAGRPLIPNSLSRRAWLLNAGGGGLGLIALSKLLSGDRLFSAQTEEAHAASQATIPLNPLRPRAPHFAPRAKNCIFIFLDGGPSQFELFENKPTLREMDGQKLPESFTQNVRFAFLDSDRSTVTAPKPRFQKHGECGM
jgi:hypothetical protein